MKTRLRTLFMFWVICACIVSLFITSCSDFFADNDLDKKIQAALEYANAKSYKLYVRSDSAYGSFLAEGERDWKLGDTLDLQFTLNKESYYFLDLKQSVLMMKNKVVPIVFSLHSMKKKAI